MLAWIRTAKENLPAMNNGSVSTDRIAEMSALLDRLHRQADGLRVARNTNKNPTVNTPATAAASPQRKAA